MNEGTIEAIIRDMMPEYGKKILVAGNEDYTTMVLIWEEEGRTGTTLVHLFDSSGDPLNIYQMGEDDVRKGVKVLLHLRNTIVHPESHPTRVISVEK